MAEHHSTVFWSELITSDIEASVEFYTRLMGWSVQKVPMDGFDYHVFSKGDEMVAGAMQKSEALIDVPDYWMTYLSVPDVDKAADDVVANGGKVLNAPFDVPGTGRIAIVGDSTGAIVGLMTPSDM